MISTTQTERLIERLVFNYRKLIILMGIALTLFFGYHATQLQPAPSFEKMIPMEHEYIKNYLSHQEDVPSGNIIQISVEATQGDIFTPEYLESLRQISDEAFFLNGVDRAAMKSLWTKNLTWTMVTEDGFEGGIVIADSYDGTAETIPIVRRNIMRAGVIGTLVANDFKSSIIQLPIMSNNPNTGEAPNYSELSDQLELLRAKYGSDSVKLHIVGFGKLVGNLIDGISSVAMFFILSVVLTLILLYGYSRCVRATILPVVCSLLAVLWQLGMLNVMGLGLDPYSILVPFLVFAIGVSHAVQIVNAMAIESGRGLDKFAAAKMAFQDLAGPGLSALLSDAIGFMTLMLIPIMVIRELGIGATVGVVVIIITNLVLLPVLFSFIGISKSGVEHAAYRENKPDRLSDIISMVTTKSYSRVVAILALLMVGFGFYFSQNLTVGDLDKGAPEFHPNSEYNQDVNFIVDNYSTSSDILVLMVESGEYECVSFETLDVMDRLQWKLQQLDSVQNVNSVVNETKNMSVLLNDGHLKWYTIPRNQKAIFSNVQALPEGLFYNNDCNLSLIYVALNDHKADTLSSVVNEVKLFMQENNNEDVRILLGAGNAGIAAATNEEIERSQMVILIAVYSVVFLMVFATFRSFTAALCIILPLTVTSVLGQALMAQIGIGVKVATLPVIALGVGIGVDYGIYIYSRIKYYLEQGLGLQEAYLNCLRTTGKAVIFTGMTLALGVCTWVFSPIKFQADMGLILTFMFLWNMLGALVLLPSLLYLLSRSKNTSNQNNQSSVTVKEQIND
jgi:predicted RND superfamily exporter protein